MSDNKAIVEEVDSCSRFLQRELECPAAPIALRAGAHKVVIRVRRLRQMDYRFMHDTQHALGAGQALIDSRDGSRNNETTRRLTLALFVRVLAAARARLA